MRRFLTICIRSLIAALVFTSPTTRALTPNLPAGNITGNLVINTRLGQLHHAVLAAPRPAIPPALLRRAAGGHGLFAVDIGTVSGIPFSVRVLKSTGSWDVDNALINAFYEWRFQPRAISKAIIPVDIVRAPRQVPVR